MMKFDANTVRRGSLVPVHEPRYDRIGTVIRIDRRIAVWAYDPGVGVLVYDGRSRSVDRFHPQGRKGEPYVL